MRGEVDDLYGNRIQKTKGPARIFFCQAFASNFNTLNHQSYPAVGQIPHCEINNYNILILANVVRSRWIQGIRLGQTVHGRVLNRNLEFGTSCCRIEVARIFYYKIDYKFAKMLTKHIIISLSFPLASTVPLNSIVCNDYLLYSLTVQTS